MGELQVDPTIPAAAVEREGPHYVGPMEDIFLPEIVPMPIKYPHVPELITERCFSNATADAAQVPVSHPAPAVIHILSAAASSCTQSPVNQLASESQSHRTSTADLKNLRSPAACSLLLRCLFCFLFRSVLPRFGPLESVTRL